MSKPVPFSSADTTAAKLAKLTHLRQVSNLWDQALGIPGTRWRVGLESLVGLLPVGGDFVGLLLSSYIVIQAVRLGLPRPVLSRMLFNILIDAGVGSVPILGDLFDTTWKANTKNVDLLEAHLQTLETSHQTDNLQTLETSHQTDKRLIWVLVGSILLAGGILLTLFILLLTLIGKLIYP